MPKAITFYFLARMRNSKSRAIDNVSCVRHSKRTGQSDTLVFKAASGLIFLAEICRNAIAQ